MVRHSSRLLRRFTTRSKRVNLTFRMRCVSLCIDCFQHCSLQLCASPHAYSFCQRSSSLSAMHLVAVPWSEARHCWKHSKRRTETQRECQWWWWLLRIDCCKGNVPRSRMARRTIVCGQMFLRSGCMALHSIPSQHVQDVVSSTKSWSVVNGMRQHMGQVSNISENHISYTHYFISGTSKIL